MTTTQLQHKPGTQDQINGTSYKGTIFATYKELVEKFGNPNGESFDGKVKNQWIIDFGGGIVASIYDYKQNLNTGKPEDWHIGGKSPAVVQLVGMAFKGE